MQLTEEYSRIIQTIFKRRPSLCGRDLKRMQSLLNEWKDPHVTYPCVHVAGTNGKGQATAKIAHALQDAGYRVGCYISPHLFDYRERITINGQLVPKEVIVSYFRELNAISDKLNLHPNFFECTTMYAFRYFHDQKVDIAILETGLGGLFDSTNVITPLVSVITSISFDHTERLGKTLDEIAVQKAGIIKQNVPLVIGPNARLDPILKKASELNCPISIAEKNFSFYDEENKTIAEKALQFLQKNFKLSKDNIKAGLAFSLPCRFERKGRVIYDVSHNPHGFERLSEALAEFYPNQKFRFLIGMSDSKDYKKCLEKIKDKAYFTHFVTADSPTALPAENLLLAWCEMTSCPCSIEESVYSGFKKAKAADNEMLVVCGSFYIMQAARCG